MSEKTLGRFCWFDLMTPEPDEATEFYGPVTGWGTTPYEGGEKPYTMWTNGEEPIGGVMDLPAEATAAGAPPHWMAYISTPDLETTVDKAKELGAVVLNRIEVPDVGSIAVMADPYGGVFAAYEPTESTPGHDGAPQVGEFSWHELYIDDAEAALDFYCTLFGWERHDEMDMGDRGTYRMFGKDGQTLGGFMTRMDDMPPHMWMYYIRVPDIEAAASQVEAAGGEVWNGPMEIPGGDYVAHCRDPHGAGFALHSSGA